MIKKLFLFFAAMAFTTAIDAQLVTVECKDTALTNNAKVMLGWNIKDANFDHGKYTYYNDSLKGKAQIAFTMGNEYFTAVAEPGKQLNIKVAYKDGQLDMKYKGENATETEFNNLLDKFLPARNKGYEERTGKTDTISYPDAFKLLDTQYARLNKLSGMLPQDPARNEDLQLRYLDNRLELLADRDDRLGRSINDDAEYQKLLAEINPNDEKFTAQGLINLYITSKLPMKVDSNTDVTDYGVAMLTTIDKYIQNRDIKNNMDEDLISSILGADEVDVKRFWDCAQEHADTSLLRRYQFVVDARLNTRSGMKCPDVSFSDPDGKEHKLSDYFGKVLYIDLWATWCGPCQMEIPYLAKHVEEYKGNPNITFISISVDREKDRGAWLKQVKNDKPAWPQFMVNKEENEVISRQWGVISIPRFLVINADGTIANNDAFRPSDDNFKQKLDAIIAVQK